MDYYWGKFVEPRLANINLVNVAYDTSGSYIIAMADNSVILFLDADSGYLLAQSNYEI